MSRFTKATAGDFYKEHQGKAFYPNLESLICSDVVIGMELVSPDAVAKWRQCLGSTNSAQAEAGTIRNLYGTDGTKNACHGADS